MLRDVLTARSRMLMPRKGAALVLGFIVSQMTLAPWQSKPDRAAQLVLWPNSDPASSLNEVPHHTTEARLRHFTRSWTHRHITFERVRRDRGPDSNVGLASAPSDAPPKESTAREKSSPAMTILELDPFNSYARAIAAPEMEIQGLLVDDYLFEAYRRLPQKRDASGDFTWKDPAAAEHFGLPLDRYVIGGMDPDFRELIYAAGRNMDAAGIKWSILAAFRDDWRQQIASGFKASADGSCHGGSRAVGGYGHGRCIDLWTTEGPVDAMFAWIDRVGRKFGLLRPMPGADPAHVSTVGDWRAIAYRLRVERLTAAMIAAVSALAGSDLVAGLTAVVTSPEWEMPPAMASALQVKKSLPVRFTARRSTERINGRHALLSCSRPSCSERRL
jgi:hypothetical protein